MKVVLRTTVLSLMVVAPSPGDAILMAQGMNELDGKTVLSAKADPMGGPEYLAMTRQMAEETGAYVPGHTTGWANWQGEPKLWQVVISFEESVEWAQPQPAGNPVPTAAGAGKSGGGEGEGRVAGSINPAEGNGPAPVAETPAAPLVSDPNDR